VVSTLLGYALGVGGCPGVSAGGGGGGGGVSAAAVAAGFVDAEMIARPMHPEQGGGGGRSRRGVKKPSRFESP
jgi:hypothetical protein